jgi:hypothetical protein
MNERVRRHWAAAEAMVLARGGISVVSRATGMSRNTIRVGIAELNERGDSDRPSLDSRIRRPGGGGKPLKETNELNGTRPILFGTIVASAIIA